MRRSITRFGLTGMFVLATLAGCGSGTSVDTQSTPTSSASSGLSQPAPSGTLDTGSGSIAAFEGTLEQIYASVSPSVVHVAVAQQITQPAEFPVQPGGGQQAQSGLGSGFVWDTSGHIVTNNHVVADADAISVTFSDGSVYPATVVGTDVNSDLAVLKIDAPASLLTPLTIADSTDVRVGQLAVAIGNPFGLDNTMTVGFISAIGRSLPVENSVPNQASYIIPDIIQTDAPINPGNSGGVLLNSAGQVVGVTAAIVSSTDASAGIGFAIPTSVVQRVVPGLISSGSYQHPWLGISGATLSALQATAMDLPPTTRGALVISVASNGPAAQGGLRGSTQTIERSGAELLVGGDVITAINATPVTSFDDLISYLESSVSVGDTLDLTIMRDGQQQSITVQPAARPSALQP